MGLKPLEFKDCLTDSPYFRENLHAHEKELEKTSSQIKVLVKDVKEILNAARCKWKLFSIIYSLRCERKLQKISIYLKDGFVKLLCKIRKFISVNWQ